jgi:Fe-S-cluster-containing hydrogenase component 2
MIFSIDSKLCRNCQACALACSLYHYGECSLDLARLRIHKDIVRYEFEIFLCRQCASPDCIADCPNQSIRFDENGRVILFEDECLQCGACAEACSYHAIFYNGTLARYLKCNLCSGRAGGPLCVALCPVGALVLTMETPAEV